MSSFLNQRQTSLRLLTAATAALFACCLQAVTADTQAQDQGAASASDGPVAGPPAAVPPIPATPSGRLVGAASCAAASCHGGGRRIEGLHFSASLVWAGRDPHANAWDVLNTPRSKTMLELLGAGQASAPPSAVQDARCLNCHATVEQPLTGTVPVNFLHHDGVGCEACHGAARDWIGPHVTSDWKSLPATAKAALGYVELGSSLTERARRCAECHVGGVGRDVNHDLIAAGHPRLDYEFSTFHTNYPRHWQPRADSPDKTDLEQSPTFTLDAWQAGRFAAAEACLKLLEDRTTAGRPWPELAEYSCFSCHHNLENRSWYQQRRSNGRPGWETWSLTPLRNSQNTELLPLTSSIKTLAGQMNQSAPDRLLVSRSARTSLTALQPLLTENHQWTTPSVDALCLEQIRGARRTTTDGTTLAAASWDEMAQLYLALRAAVAARRTLDTQDTRNEKISQHLEVIRSQLLFQPGYDSPGTSSIDPVLAISAAVNQIELLLDPKTPQP